MRAELFPFSGRLRAALLALCCAVSSAAAAAAAAAAGVQERVAVAGVLRVCIWPDYYGISLRHPRTQELKGLDIDLAAELAHDLKVRVEYVDSSFQTLIADVAGDRCDVAMFAIARLPQRMEHLAFTRAYLQSGIYGITTKNSRVITDWSDIDKPGVVVAVQAGTSMELAMARTLKHAQLARVKPPATRERELESGRVDVFMTDYPYSRRLLDNADWARLISPPQPFSVQPYAYAVKQGDGEWLKVVDDFVVRIQRDGRLDAAARKHGLSAIVVR